MHQIGEKSFGGAKFDGEILSDFCENLSVSSSENSQQGSIKGLPSGDGIILEFDAMLAGQSFHRSSQMQDDPWKDEFLTEGEKLKRLIETNMRENEEFLRQL